MRDLSFRSLLLFGALATLGFDDVQPKPIQQLWAQLSLLGITRANQDKASRMFNGNALALHFVNTCYPKSRSLRAAPIVATQQ